jgi:hypothetical protein
MRYLASVVTQCFTAFGELLALHKRFAELTGGVVRCPVQHMHHQRLSRQCRSRVDQGIMNSRVASCVCRYRHKGRFPLLIED